MKIPKIIKAMGRGFGVKHQVINTLTTGEHRNLVNGNLTVIGFDGNSGQKEDNILLKEGYEANSQAYSIIKKIMESGSDIPWVPKILNSDGTTKLVTKGKFFNFVNNPNERQTQKDFKESSYGYICSTGDLFWNPQEIIGFKATRDLRVLPSQLMEVTKTNDNPLTPTGYVFELGRIKESFSTEEIIHLKYFNPTTEGIESLRGMSPLTAAWLTLSGDNQRAIAQDSMMKNRGAAGIITNESDIVATKDERDIQQGLLDRMMSGAKNFNRLIAGKSKAKFIQLGMSSSDLKILETGIENLRILCNVFGAPSELFNDPANKTFANQKTALKAFYENAVLPIDRRLLAKFNNEIVSQWSRQDGVKYIVTQDLSHIGALQEDEKAKADKDRSVLQGVNIVLGMTVSSEAKVLLLVNQYGYTKEDAEKIVAPAGKKNDTLEILKSVSPLLANKLIEKMSDEEVLSLLK